MYANSMDAQRKGKRGTDGFMEDASLGASLGK